MCTYVERRGSTGETRVASASEYVSFVCGVVLRGTTYCVLSDACQHDLMIDEMSVCPVVSRVPGAWPGARGLIKRNYGPRGAISRSQLCRCRRSHRQVAPRTPRDRPPMPVPMPVHVALSSLVVSRDTGTVVPTPPRPHLHTHRPRVRTPRLVVSTAAPSPRQSRARQ